MVVGEHVRGGVEFTANGLTGAAARVCIRAQLRAMARIDPTRQPGMPLPAFVLPQLLPRH